MSSVRPWPKPLAMTCPLFSSVPRGDGALALDLAGAERVAADDEGRLGDAGHDRADGADVGGGVGVAEQQLAVAGAADLNPATCSGSSPRLTRSVAPLRAR
jgi:hypothetical protein